MLILDDDFENLKVVNEVSGVFSAPWALAVATRDTQDSFLAADSGAVVEALLPVDTPEAVWYAMKAELEAGDFQAALEYILEGSRARYEEAFTALADRLPGAVAGWSAIAPVKIYDDMATYSFQKEELVDGQPRMVTHSVTFVRDETGRWRIAGF